jgi:hypothetical protein
MKKQKSWAGNWAELFKTNEWCCEATKRQTHNFWEENISSQKL